MGDKFTVMRRLLFFITLAIISFSPLRAQQTETTYTRPVVDMTGYTYSDQHFTSLYASADAKYAWRNWKGSFKKWQKNFRADPSETLGVTRTWVTTPASAGR